MTNTQSRNSAGLPPGIGLHFEQRIAGRWRIRFQFGRDPSGKLVVSRVEVAPLGQVPEDGIDTRLLRRVRFSRAQTWARLTAAPKAPARRAGRHRGRPSSLGRRYYEELGREYRERFTKGETDIPKRIAEARGANRSTIRSALRRAQKLGVVILPAFLPIRDRAV